MDGALLGRPDAPHCNSSPTLRPNELPRSAFVWASPQYCRRPVPTGGSQYTDGASGDFHAAIVPSCLHAAEAKDSFMHAAGSGPRSYAYTDRLGWRLGRHGITSLVSFRC